MRTLRPGDNTCIDGKSCLLNIPAKNELEAIEDDLGPKPVTTTCRPSGTARAKITSGIAVSTARDQRTTDTTASAAACSCSWVTAEPKVNRTAV